MGGDRKMVTIHNDYEPEIRRTDAEERSSGALGGLLIALLIMLGLGVVALANTDDNDPNRDDAPNVVATPTMTPVPERIATPTPFVADEDGGIITPTATVMPTITPSVTVQITEEPAQ